MESCCLCRVSVDSVLEKKRRKKLYGASCQEARQALNIEVKELFGLGLQDFQDTKGENSYLCKKCDSALNTIQTMQSKLSLLRSEIKTHLTSFQQIIPVAITASTAHDIAAGKKRSLPSTSTSSEPKRVCQHDPVIESDILGAPQSVSPAVSVSCMVV